jgi:hypothetical protein
VLIQAKILEVLIHNELLSRCPKHNSRILFNDIRVAATTLRGIRELSCVRRLRGLISIRDFFDAALDLLHIFFRQFNHFKVALICFSGFVLQFTIGKWPGASFFTDYSIILRFHIFAFLVSCYN